MFWKFNPLSLASLASILSHSAGPHFCSLEKPVPLATGWSLAVAPEVVTCWVAGLNPRASPTADASGLPPGAPGWGG